MIKALSGGGVEKKFSARHCEERSASWRTTKDNQRTFMLIGPNSRLISYPMAFLLSCEDGGEIASNQVAGNQSRNDDVVRVIKTKPA
jgi:hypothetical protein